MTVLRTFWADLAKRQFTTIALALAVVLIGAMIRTNPGFGADWPQWGGQNSRNMVSSQTGLPDTFTLSKPETRPASAPVAANHVKWVAPLGGATYGSPVVSNGKVFIGTSDAGKGCLLCLDEQTGRELGRFYPKRPSGGKGYTFEAWGICSTPTVEKDRLYILSASQQVLCLDVNILAGQAKSAPATAPGDEACLVWQYDLVKELYVLQQHVSSCSPLVYGDYVYVCTGNTRSDHGGDKINYSPLSPSLVVLDKKTGKLVARDDEHIGERLYRGQWSSPSFGIIGDKPQIIFGGGDGVCYAFAPVDPDAKIEAGRKVSLELRQPLVQYVRPATQPSTRDSTTKPVQPKSVPRYPSQVSTVNLPGGGAVQVIYRHSNFDSVSVHLDAIPRLDLPDVPLLKKVWWFDCIPSGYKDYCMGTRAKGQEFVGMAVEIAGTPVVYRNRVYAAIGGDPHRGGAYTRGNLVCIDAGKTGELTAAGQVWHYDALAECISTLAVADGLVYALDDAAVLHCLDADTGQCYWKQNISGPVDDIFGSPLVADGKIYVPGNKQLYVFATGKEAKKIATIELDSQTESTPCAANGVLYVATFRNLWAITK